MTQGLLLECAVYHLHGTGPIHLSRCLYISIIVESVSSDQIQNRLYYVMANWRCMAVRIKKNTSTLANSFHALECETAQLFLIISIGKTDVRHHGGKLLVSVGLLMETTLRHDLVVQNLVPT